MSILSFVVNKAAPPPKIEDYKRFLFLGPHPDDIEIGAGGTAAKLAAAGKQVSFLICTDGRYGLDYMPGDMTPEALALIRKEESIGAAAKLGVRDVHFLGLQDGGGYEREELICGIARVIGELEPEVIFAPDPCVDSECHTDHLNTGEAARRLAFFAPFAQIMASYGAKSADVQAIAYYMTAKPNQYIETGRFRAVQAESIRRHRSQFPENSEAWQQLDLYLRLRSTFFGLRRLKCHAEGFRVLGRTQMHCLPEAGL